MRGIMLASGLMFGGVVLGQGVDPCIQAGALIDARLPTADKAHWFKALESCTAANGRQVFEYVQEAIQQRVYDELQVGAEAARDGQLKSALVHFEAALGLDPGSSQAAGSLEALRGAMALHTAAEARELAATSKVDDAVKLLNDSDNVATAPWLIGVPFRALVAANLQFLIEVVVVIGALGWLAFRLWRRGHARPVLELRDFSNNILAPGIEQAIQAMLINLSRGSGVSASALLRVTRPLEETPLPVDISKVLPASASWMQVIPGLIARILPRPTLPISGVLHQDAVKGAGVTIHAITQEGAHLSETFWQSQFGAVTAAKKNQSAHYALAEYVAIWLLFELSKKEGVSLLGTTQWRAYALFRAGVNAEDESGKSYYLSALRVDDKIHAARLNIGLLAQTEQRPLVLDLFQCAADKAEASDATRYQARYSLASLLYDVKRTDDAIEQMKTLFRSLFETCNLFGLREDLKQQSKACYVELAKSETGLVPPSGTGAAQTLVAEDQAAKRISHTELEQYIDYLLPIARAMSLGLLISSNHKNADALAALKIIAQGDQSPRVRYNLACANSLVAQGLVLEIPQEAAARDAQQTQALHSALKQGLESLALALWLNPLIGKKVRDDRALSGLRDSAEVLDGETVSVSAQFEQIATTYIGPRAWGADVLGGAVAAEPAAAALLILADG
jgi:hypothetical protein